MRIKDICSRVVVVAETGTDLREAARLMRDHHVGALVVVQGGNGGRRPIGIVTDQDLRNRVVAAGHGTDRPVSGIMSAPLVRINDRALLFEAARTLPVDGGDIREVQATITVAITLDADHAGLRITR